MAITSRGFGNNSNVVSRGFGNKLGGIIADIWKQIINFRLKLNSSRLGNG